LNLTVSSLSFWCFYVFVAGFAFYCRFVGFDGVYVLCTWSCWLLCNGGWAEVERTVDNELLPWVQCLRHGYYATSTSATRDVAPLIEVLCAQIKRAADKI